MRVVQYTLFYCILLSESEFMYLNTANRRPVAQRRLPCPQARTGVGRSLRLPHVGSDRRPTGYDQSITYGGKTILSEASGIADTGTTLILLPTEAYNMYRAETGAVPDGATGLLSVTAAQFAQMQSLIFVVNGVSPNLSFWATHDTDSCIGRLCSHSRRAALAAVSQRRDRRDARRVLSHDREHGQPTGTRPRLHQWVRVPRAVLLVL